MDELIQYENWDTKWTTISGGQKQNVNTNDDADDCVTQHIKDCVALHYANTHKHFH